MSYQDPGKILLAVAAGFVAGLLFAPRSGKETREQIRHKADEAKEKANEFSREARQKAESGKQKAASLFKKAEKEERSPADTFADYVRRNEA